MSKINDFLKRKQIQISVKRYFIDSMSAMVQGLFCTLLVGTFLQYSSQMEMDQAW